jgi:hypothetical protein
MLIAPLLAQFESASMESKFTLAARKTLEIISKGDWHSVDHATDVEPALDFLEDIGLQITKNQISDELAHQYLFATIQAYYLALKSYINDHQKLYGKATWRYVEPLFERTFLIERSIDKTAPKHLSEKEIIQFLRQEAEKPPQI